MFVIDDGVVYGLRLRGYVNAGNSFLAVFVDLLADGVVLVASGAFGFGGYHIVYSRVKVIPFFAHCLDIDIYLKPA